VPLALGFQQYSRVKLWSIWLYIEPYSQTSFVCIKNTIQTLLIAFYHKEKDYF
jgi:hypothetical protein